MFCTSCPIGAKEVVSCISSPKAELKSISGSSLKWSGSVFSGAVSRLSRGCSLRVGSCGCGSAGFAASGCGCFGSAAGSLAGSSSYSGSALIISRCCRYKVSRRFLNLVTSFCILIRAICSFSMLFCAFSKIWSACACASRRIYSALLLDSRMTLSPSFCAPINALRRLSSSSRYCSTFSASTSIFSSRSSFSDSSFAYSPATCCKNISTSSCL